MLKRWKHWTALLLLVICGTSAVAAVGAGFCMADTSSLVDVRAAMDDARPDPTPCPLVQLAELATTPILFALLAPLGVDISAYVRPLFPSRLHGIDPEPPVKPPVA